MALNLSRNTKVFVSSVNGVHASGGSVQTLDTIGGTNTNHAVLAMWLLLVTHNIQVLDLK